MVRFSFKGVLDLDNRLKLCCSVLQLYMKDVIKVLFCGEIVAS